MTHRDPAERGAAAGPAVCVVIPAFNRSGTIARALRSALTQTYAPREVIVVDDASTDDTAEMASRLGDPRVRVLRQERNLGPAAARNAGIRAASCPLIAFLDSDDEWYPGKLERQVELLQGLPPDVALLTCGYERLHDGVIERRIPAEHEDLYEALLRENVLRGGCSCAVARRDCLLDAGLFDERLRHAEDHDLWLRLAAKYRIVRVPEVLVRVSTAEANRVTDDLEATRDALAFFEERYGPSLPRRERGRIYGRRHRYLGLQWVRRGERRRAIVAFLRSLKRFPWSARTWGYLALACLPASGARRLRAAWRLVRPRAASGREGRLAG